MTRRLRILYATPRVLGDAGANAADIFPRLCAKSDAIERVIVADFPKNKYHIQERQGAEYLRLEWKQSTIRYAARVARKAKAEHIDIIHVFYRQQNAVLLILIRVFLLCLGSHARLVMDHRSVNLAKGWRRFHKIALNTFMQLFCHQLTGNPWAVETNHFRVFRPKSTVDLGYDEYPTVHGRAKLDQNKVNVWFIGSLKPKNRKSDFLLKIFHTVQSAAKTKNISIQFHVAGPTTDAQAAQLQNIPNATYHGVMKRHDLYALLQQTPGLGLAYMNSEFHEFAPSLKFAEYAIMQFKILASDTIGLRTQAERMNLPGVSFISEDVDSWAQAILRDAASYRGLEPIWDDADLWSYPSIFERQVLPLYRDLAEKAPTRAMRTVAHQKRKSLS